MKKTGFLILILSLGLYKAGAQRIDDTVEAMSLGAKSALTLTFSNTDDKLVESAWNDFLKDNYGAKAKYNRKADEWFADNADIVALGLGSLIDVYSRVKQSKDDVIFYLWVDLGDNFLSEKDNPERYDEAVKLLEKFELAVGKEKTRQQLSDEQDKLKKSESELEKLVGANERLHKEIEKAKEAIKKAEESILKNEEEQTIAKQKIENQKKAVDAVRKKLDEF